MKHSKYAWEIQVAVPEGFVFWQGRIDDVPTSWTEQQVGESLFEGWLKTRPEYAPIKNALRYQVRLTPA